MEPLDIQRISRILDEVIDSPPEERGRVLAERCGADAELRARLETLLAELEEDDFLCVPVVPAPLDEAAAPLIPRRIGPYELLRLIGEGGMGSVYEARQDNPRRLVAVKVLRAGLFSGEALRRFLRESQVLGVLHHPGIAQVYEAGTADTAVGKVPYFAMELIRGLPLAAYLAAERLDVRSQLGLLAQVCDAVEHAHQRGIVHRDLKPANIMVESGDEDAPAGESGTKGSAREARRPARAKILDFGVARGAAGQAASGATMQTGAGQIIGTLPYMSPEQVSGDPSGVDRRSDVYSLGVIAYEMLAGRLPIDVRGRPIPEATRSILHDEPTRLRSIDTRFAGDVDTMIAKAMEKDPARRYQAAAAFAADLRRFLRDEPIIARPATRWYQLRKFARRNRAIVLGTTATLLTLTAGVATTTFWAVRATDRRAVAERRADELLRKAYRASIAAAQAALERGQTIAARGHLDDTPDSLRGWEWEYLHGQVDRSDRTIGVASAGFAASALSGEFAMLLHAERARLLNWVTGQTVNCEAAPGISSPYALAMSPRGDRLVMCGDTTSALWDARSGALLRVFADEPRFEASPFTPDGATLALGATNPRRVVFYRAQDGAPTDQLELSAVQRVFPTVSPDGLSLLVESADNITSLIRLSDRTTLWTAPGAQPRFTPDGRGVLVYTGLDRTSVHLEVLDAATGARRRSLLLEDDLVSAWGASSSIIGMAPDQSMFAHLTPSGAIRLLDAVELAQIGSLTGLAPRRGGNYCGVAFSTDGEWLAACSHSSEIKVWNIAPSGNWVHVPTKEEVPTFAAAISKDGSLAVTGNWGQVVAWDLATGAPRWAASPSFEFVTSVVISADGSLAYIGGDRGTLRILDAASGAPIRSASPHGVMPFSSTWLGSLATAAPSRVLAGFKDGTIMLIDAQTLASVATRAFGGEISEIRFSPGGETFACLVGAEPRRVVIAASDDLRPLTQTPIDGAQSIAWSHDGSLLAVGARKRVVLLSADGRVRGEMTGVPGDQSCVCFSPGDDRVAAGSAEGTLNLWMTASCDLVLELPLPREERALAVTFGNDRGSVHVVTSTYSTIRFEVNRPDASTARARHVARRGQDLYRRSKGVGHFLPETIDEIERAPDVDPGVRAEAVRQAGLLCEHPAWLNNQAYTRIASSPNDAALRRAIRENDAAMAGSPDPFSLLTRAKLLYSAARHAEALEAMREASGALSAVRPASQWKDGPPEMCAIMGLCEAALGREEEAEGWFVVFDRVAEEPRYKDSPEARHFGELIARARTARRERREGPAAPGATLPGPGGGSR